MKAKDGYQLYLLSNCFNDKIKRHLGLKVEGKWYAITHTRAGVYIPKSCLQTNREQDNRPSFLVMVTKSAPNIIRPVSARIHKSLVDNYKTLIK